MSLYGATAGLSMVAGQILGGVLVAADIAGTGWRAVFLVNVPVALVGLVLAARTVPETRSRAPRAGGRARHAAAGRRPADAAGAADRGPGGGLAAVDLGVAGGVPVRGGRPSTGWSGARTAQGRTPLVPPSLFELVSLRRGLALVLPFSIGFGGFMFVIAVALQQGAGLGAVAAGLALAPMAVAFFVASLAGPRLVAPVRHPGRDGGRG